MPYAENEIFKKNPFATLDQTGVGQLMKIAVEKGRSTPSRHQARHLRRTRRRSGQREVLPPLGLELRAAARRTACPSPASPPRRPRSREKRGKIIACGIDWRSVASSSRPPSRGGAFPAMSGERAFTDRTIFQVRKPFWGRVISSPPGALPLAELRVPSKTIPSVCLFGRMCRKLVSCPDGNPSCLAT